MDKIKAQLREIHDVMSLRSVVFKKFYDTVMLEQKINWMRNACQILMFVFYTEIVSAHISDRTVLNKQISAICCFFIIFFMYVLSMRRGSTGMVKKMSSIIVAICVLYSIYIAIDPDEFVEYNYSVGLSLILIVFVFFRYEFLASVLITVMYSAIFLYVSYAREPMINTWNVSFIRNMSALRKLRIQSVMTTEYMDFIEGQFVLFPVILICGMYLRFFNTIRLKAGFLKLIQSAEEKMKMLSAVEIQAYWIEAIMPESVKNIFLKQIHKTDMFQLTYCQSFTNVSILFSDIIGFSLMSKNKTPEQLVYLLNDLYNRFDEVSKMLICEKLTTLGECYYCIAGCPIPRSDHALSCVEMGLTMCRLIVSFNRDHREDVSLRVGIHSGKVIAAIIGNHRFRFDVFSNDVTIANLVEISGKPGLVHISEDTYKLVRHAYVCEEGENLAIKIEEVQVQSGLKKHLLNIKTFFVLPSNADKVRYSRSLQNTNTSNNEITEADVVSEKIFLVSEHDEYYKIDKLRQDVEIIQFLQRDPDRPFDVFQYSSMSTLTLMFKDKEVEEHFRNHTLIHVKRLQIESIKLALLFDSIMCLLLSLSIMGSLYISILRFTFYLGVKHVYPWIAILVGVILTFINALVSLIYPSEIENVVIGKLFQMLNLTVVRVILAILISSVPHVTAYLTGSPLIYVITFKGRYLTCVLFGMVGHCFYHGCYYFIKFLTIIVISVISATMFFWEDLPVYPHTLRKYKGLESCTGYLEVFYNSDRSRGYYFSTFQLLGMVPVIYFIIRQNEKITRVLFFAEREASIRKQESKRAKKVAENLLYNIIPEYIFAQIISDKSNQYKEMKFNFADYVSKAGVLFACISNFFDSFEQTNFRQGEIAMRLLHKIICTFDNLLEKNNYKSLEKIKTINDCYMLASGLKPMNTSTGNESHLITLMHFAFEIKYQLNSFNQQNDLTSDSFTLKIGYNFGPVTIGIVGKTKPLFDIWGETVTIASRMYSTALAGTIQVPEQVVPKLNQYFEFKYRGSLPIKNKGVINTHFVIKPL